MTQTIAQALLAAALDASDARVLMRHALAVDAVYLVAHDRDVLTPAQCSAFDALVVRRRAGEPVAYITAMREFFGLEFQVAPAVLIPRPETELLVEWALEKITRTAEARVLDLGTGSGCIAISIAHERPRTKVTAVDSSSDALDVARVNAQRLLLSTTTISAFPHQGGGRSLLAPSPLMGQGGGANLSFVQSDWFSALVGQRFDLIVSNPPYIAAGDAHLAQGDLRFEPAGALSSGKDGLDAIRLIVTAAPQYLQAGGWLVFEHGYDQAARCRAWLEAAGYTQVFSHCDLAGIERISGGRLDAIPSKS